MPSVLEAVQALKSQRKVSYKMGCIHYVFLPLAEPGFVERHAVLVLHYGGQIQLALQKRCQEAGALVWSPDHGGEVALYLISMRKYVKVDFASIIGTVEGFRAVKTPSGPIHTMQDVQKPVTPIVKIPPKENRFSAFTDDPFWVKIFSSKLEEDHQYTQDLK